MNKGKFDVRCHATWLTARFIISFAQVMMKYKNETIKSDKMYTCVRLACTDPETRKPFAVFPNKDGNTRGKDKKDTSFSVSLKSFNEVLKNLDLDKYLNFHGNKGGTYSIGTIDLESLNAELYGKSNEPMNIIEALADRVRKTSLSKIRASQQQSLSIEGENASNKEEPQEEAAPAVPEDMNKGKEEEKLAETIRKPHQKKSSPASLITRRSYSPKLLREARYIGILAKYGPKIKMKMDLREIVGILTNNYLLEFTDVFSNSQELKTRICSGKLSTVFSLASDSTIRYKAMGQGIVSFTELNMKYQMSNDIQEASLLVYDPHHEWRNSVNSSYVDTFDIKSFSRASEVCAVCAHWECTPVALYNAFREFHLPIAGRYQYITMPEVPLPFIKNDIIPSLPDLSGIVTGESSKELEKFRNTIILYLADLNATA